MSTRFLFILLLIAIGGHAGADSITLRRSTETEGDAPIRLADIAVLAGPRAEALGGVVIVESADLLPMAGDRGHRLDVSIVRAKLKDEPGVNWAFLTLRGTGVRLFEPSPTVDLSAPPERVSRTDAADPVAQKIVPGTIRAIAYEVLLNILRVERADLRVRWPERHAEFLDEPVDGRLIEVEPIGKSARIPLKITVYDGDTIVRTESVRAGIHVHRLVHVVSRAIPRNTRLTTDATSTRELWVDPSVAPAGAVVGQMTTRRLEPGSVIQVGDVEPPVVIERGEKISLHCIAGAVVLKSSARALESGRDGEVIRLELIGPTRERVMARVAGRGRAVLVVPSGADSRHTKGKRP